MRSFPALDVCWAVRPEESHIERVLAGIDDAGPIALEDLPQGLRIFFRDGADRSRAADWIDAIDPAAACAVIDIPDEGWAERSQAMLTAVRVGSLVITPPWDEIAALRPTAANADPIVITIQPSMGFGTGHHPSTRRCLALLQRLTLDRRSVIDVGTGSGVLALAAWRLGASRVLGVDVDPDALEAARENVEQNDAAGGVTLQRLDVSAPDALFEHPFDVVLANLTGAMLERFAAALATLAAPDGALIVSGFQTDEASTVIAAFAAHGCAVVDRDEEESWVGVLLGGRGTEVFSTENGLKVPEVE